MIFFYSPLVQLLLKQTYDQVIRPAKKHELEIVFREADHDTKDLFVDALLSHCYEHGYNWRQVIDLHYPFMSHVFAYVKKGDEHVVKRYYTPRRQ